MFHLSNIEEHGRSGRIADYNGSGQTTWFAEYLQKIYGKSFIIIIFLVINNASPLLLFGLHPKVEILVYWGRIRSKIFRGPATIVRADAPVKIFEIWIPRLVADFTGIKSELNFSLLIYQILLVEALAPAKLQGTNSGNCVNFVHFKAKWVLDRVTFFSRWFGVYFIIP